MVMMLNVGRIVGDLRGGKEDMTEKRYKAHIFDDGINERYYDGIIDYDNDSVIRNYQYISNLLNEQHETIWELKSKVDDKEVAVEVETEKLMNKVFDLIEEKIKHAQEYYSDERADRSYYRGQLSILKELKKELKE